MELKQTQENAYVHSGVISRINRGSVIVSLDKNIHCETCHAKGACGVSDSASKEIEVVNTGQRYTLNEPVEVILKKNLGHKAVFWAYVFPFILMLLTLMTASFFVTEWIAGLLSLLILIPYYLLMHGLKGYFKRTFDISIQRI
ncbi:MAG: SoxR reducing system RseC family protein [Robiginitalea sp.]